MSALTPYSSDEPARAAVDTLPGHTVIEFGSNDCGICRSAQGLITEGLQASPDPGALRHIKVEDGRGRPLGRSFGIKLWPTLVVLRDGREVARVVRPRRSADVVEALSRLSASAAR